MSETKETPIDLTSEEAIAAEKQTREMNAAAEIDAAISHIEQKYNVKLLTRATFYEGNAKPVFHRFVLAL